MILPTSRPWRASPSALGTARLPRPGAGGGFGDSGRTPDPSSDCTGGVHRRRRQRNLSPPPRSRFHPCPVGDGRTRGDLSMETAGAGPGQPASGLEAPGSTDDRLFLVKGKVCRGEVRASRRANPGLWLALERVFTHTSRSESP